MEYFYCYTGTFPAVKDLSTFTTAYRYLFCPPPQGCFMSHCPRCHGNKKSHVLGVPAGCIIFWVTWGCFLLRDFINTSGTKQPHWGLSTETRARGRGPEPFTQPPVHKDASMRRSRDPTSPDLRFIKNIFSTKLRSALIWHLIYQQELYILLIMQFGWINNENWTVNRGHMTKAPHLGHVTTAELFYSLMKLMRCGWKLGSW